MDGIWQVVLAILASVGLLTLGWLAFTWLTAPEPGEGPVYAVVPARGDGADLERRVKVLLWQRERWGGRFTIVIADGGLDPRGRAAAALLARSGGVAICPAGRLGDYLAGN